MQTNSVGDRLSRARTSKGLTQAQLAAHVGVAITTMSRWETGAMSPSLEHLEKLSDALSVSIDWLVRGDHAPTVDGAEATREVRS